MKENEMMLKSIAGTVVFNQHGSYIFEVNSLSVDLDIPQTSIR